MSRHTLVLLRHGESTWNRANLFTGWYDADLTEIGEQQARRAGTDLAAAGVEPDVVHTSLQTRAIRTANLALDALGRSWLPVRRTWRLNERHYGALTGLDKAATAERFGPDQVQVWRRSYDTPPEPIGADNPYYADIVDDPRYRDLGDDLPTAECLRDVVERMWPWFDEGIAPDLRSGATVLVAAHGNSLRAMVKQLDGIGDDEITGLNLPTGVPVVYELDADLVPVETVPVDRISDRYLGDVAAAEAAAEAVARQAGGD